MRKLGEQTELTLHLTIPIAFLAGLAILKLFAWLDQRDARDATDLLRLFETYAAAGNDERLFDEEEELQRVEYGTIPAWSSGLEMTPIGAVEGIVTYIIGGGQ
jgi:predicted nucleotidyltransferase